MGAVSVMDVVQRIRTALPHSLAILTQLLTHPAQHAALSESNIAVVTMKGFFSAVCERVIALWHSEFSHIIQWPLQRRHSVIHIAVCCRGVQTFRNQNEHVAKVVI